MLEREKKMIEMRRKWLDGNSFRQRTFCDKHPSLSIDMRVTLVDWMSQVSADYFMKRQTFHRSVMMLDNYLMRCNE